MCIFAIAFIYGLLLRKAERNGLRGSRAHIIITVSVYTTPDFY